jgi:hypothetical protein
VSTATSTALAGPALGFADHGLQALHEAVAAVDLAVAIGTLATSEAEVIQALGLRVKWMLRALMR